MSIEIHPNSRTDAFDNIVNDAMQTSLGFVPRPFQRKVISHIIRMKHNDSDHPTTPTLLVQGTGGGKSSVYQTVGVIKRGITLIVQNTLALSSDQMVKTQQISRRVQNCFCLQLDSVKSKSDQASIRSVISSLNSKSPSTLSFSATCNNNFLSNRSLSF